jgi:hypothetical protein
MFPLTTSRIAKCVSICCLFVSSFFVIGCDEIVSNVLSGIENAEHDKLAMVSSPSWVIGEHKDCDSVASSADDEPTLTCGSFYETRVEARRFKVAFHGPTFMQGEVPTKTFEWDCRKNNDDDVVISCWHKQDKSGSTTGVDSQSEKVVGPLLYWTSPEEPPGHIDLTNGECPKGYQPVSHLSGPGGRLLHRECAPY